MEQELSGGSGHPAINASAHEAEVERRRQAQESDHHRTIWSKAPHCGPYYQVTPAHTAHAKRPIHCLNSPSSQPDHELCSEPHSTAQAPHTSLLPSTTKAPKRGSQGVILHDELPGWVATAGYERVVVGQTTNLVGDAMSQAAVALVHEQLKDGGGPTPFTSAHQASAVPHWSTTARASHSNTASTGRAERDTEDIANAVLETQRKARQRFQERWAVLQAQGKVPTIS
mmetsp:Transcript_21527/g.36684  ORF Transcript_21527/g.36684 Transcript_21527/m.36684 type:complete len:228 (-) Transcript_21527:176-859(-)